MRVEIVLVLVLLLVFTPLHGQSRDVSGIVVDSATSTPLPGARVTITHEADSTMSGAIVDRRGRFVVRGVREGSGVINVRNIGYATFTDTINVQRAGASVDTIRLAQSQITTPDIFVTARALRVLQRGDTTEYNARAFNVDSNANANQLVRQLPGVTMANGTVKAQGETVDNILVDGQPFFGNDVTATLMNLPAGIVDKVEIYDSKSEEAKFTNTEEASTTKTMNIVTKEDKRFGYFGQVLAGYGDRDRYQGYGTMNHFDSLTRVTVLALSNNINEQNFSFEDIMRGVDVGSTMSDGYIVMDDNSALGAFTRPERDGIVRTNAVGANVSTRFGGTSQASLNYVAHDGRLDAASSTVRSYFAAGEETQSFRQVDTSTSTGQDHKIIANLRYDIDTATRITVQPNITWDQSRSDARFDGATSFGGALSNATATRQSSESSRFALRSDVSVLHRFAKPRRSITLRVRGNTSATDGNSTLLATSLRGEDIGTPDTTDQRGTLTMTATSIAPSLSYNEPFGERLRLTIAVDGSTSSSRSDRNTFIDLDGTKSYSTTDTLLSNVFRQSTQTIGGASTLSWSDSTIQISAGLRYQSLNLSGESVFPFASTTSTSFSNALPNASITFLAMQDANLNITYEAETQTPTIQQMQNVVNNSNPMVLSVGDPTLDQTLTHNVSASYSSSLTDLNGYAYLVANAGYTTNPIATSTVIAARDTVSDGIPLLQGAQLTRPINLDKAFDAGIFGYVGVALDSIPFHLSADFGLNANRSPSLINAVSNTTVSTSLRASGSVSYYRDQEHVVSGTVRVDHSTFSNDLRTDLNTSFTTLQIIAGVTWMFWKNIIIRADVQNRRNSGLSAGFGQNIVLLNIALSKKVFADERGEFTISVRDALNQNQNINRVVQAGFAEDRQLMQLRRVAMATFTYRFRAFGESMAP
jgi:hypothetical protein